MVDETHKIIKATKTWEEVHFLYSKNLLSKNRKDKKSILVMKGKGKKEVRSWRERDHTA